MNKKNTKPTLSGRLTLTRHSLRVLTAEQLTQVVGAQPPPTSSIKEPITCN